MEHSSTTARATDSGSERSGSPTPTTMKTCTTIALAVALAAPSFAGETLAIRVGRAETVSHGVVEHAVILVEDGKIAIVGEDLPVERGIPVLDRPEWTVVPGFVNCYSRLGCDSEGGDDNSPDVKAIDELWPKSPAYKEVVEHGVTTLALYPAGNGISGQSVTIRPLGATAEEMVLKDGQYVKIVVRSDSPSKRRITDAFKKVAEYDEKVVKAREKFDKDKKGGSKKDEKADDKKSDEKKAFDPAAQEAKSDDKKDEKKDDGFVPPQPDEKLRPWLEMRVGAKRGLVAMSQASDWLHFQDALGKNELAYDLRLVLQRESDLYHVFEKKTNELDVDGIGDKKLRCVVEPTLTVAAGTLRTRNLPHELHRSGAKVVFIPRNDSLGDHQQWRSNVGEVVSAGLPADVALRAMTLEAAEVAGVADLVGSIEKGKHANLVFLTGAPFEASTKIAAVMLDGEFVHGEVNQ
jgi:imidazolonepropionase-like amidohydrolase